MENNDRHTPVPAEDGLRKPELDRHEAMFVAKNVDYYALKWSQRDARGNVKATWNGAAFLGGPIWLIYRKLYWQGAAYMVGGAILSIGLDALNAGLGFVFSYGLPIFFGFAANKLYRTEVEKEVAALRARYRLGSELETQLIQRGGTNPLGAWIAGIAMGLSATALIWLIVQGTVGQI